MHSDSCLSRLLYNYNVSAIVPPGFHQVPMEVDNLGIWNKHFIQSTIPSTSKNSNDNDSSS